MDFSTIKSITIPEGEVKKIQIGSTTIWEKQDTPTQVQHVYLNDLVGGTNTAGINPSEITIYGVKFDNNIPLPYSYRYAQVKFTITPEANVTYTSSRILIGVIENDNHSHTRWLESDSPLQFVVTYAGKLFIQANAGTVKLNGTSISITNWRYNWANNNQLELYDNNNNKLLTYTFETLHLWWDYV